MEILIKNLKVLEKKDGKLAERLRSFRGAGVEFEKTRSGDFTFKHAGRYFHSRYDPRKEARMQVLDMVDRKFDWVLTFGLGCGYLLEALIEEGREKVIVYEPSMEILLGVLSTIDLSGPLSLDTVHLSGDMAAAMDCIRGNVDGMDNLLSYQTVPYRQTFPGEMKDFSHQTCNALITGHVGIKTDIASRIPWIENYFANIESFVEHPPIDVLRDRFKDKPLVIAGAGPSLARNAHLLREIKGRAVIIAAVTAYRPLLKYGVIPDFVIVAEKVPLPKYFIGGSGDRDIRLILGEVSHPSLFEVDTKSKFVFFNPFVKLSVAHARMWGSSYFPSTGGSVTTAALDIGRMLGCDPIIFIGQDLAFGEGRTHAEGTVYVDQNITMDKAKGTVTVVEERHMSVPDPAPGGEVGRVHCNIQWLKGLDGKPVPSKFDWATFHQWFEKYMRLMKEDGIKTRVINATEGGAYIEGMEHITLAAAIARHVTVDIGTEDVIKEAIGERGPVDFPALRDSFVEMLDGMRCMKKEAGGIIREARKVRKGLKKDGLTVALKKNVDKIRRIEEDLFKKFADAGFVWEALSAYTYELREYLKEERDEEPLEQFNNDLASVLKTYRKVEEMTERFIPVLEEALARVEGYLPAGNGVQGVQGEGLLAKAQS